MRKINENTKVTLTIGQLKRLVNEGGGQTPEDDRRLLEAVKNSKMKNELLEKFLAVCKAYIKEMDERVSYKKTNIEARAVNALYGVYLDYSALRHKYTKDDAKTALEIFKKYAKQVIEILSEMKKEHPELEWSFENTLMSSALIGKSLFISNTGDIFPDFEYGNGEYMKINENSKVTLTFGQLKRLVKESKHLKTLTEADENEYKKIPFKRSELMALGFRDLTKSEDHFWSDALPEAVVLCTPFIYMICGNDNGNRRLEVSLPTDKESSWLVYDPSNENIKKLLDDSYPEKTIKHGENADFLVL